MRIGMIHQPHFLPWPGYLARCLAVDVFVVLDNVKFNRNHYQQRTKFVDRNGQLRWLSLPIDGSTRSGIISNVKIAAAFVVKKWQGQIVEAYRDAPLFDRYWGETVETILRYYPSLCNVSVALLEWSLSILSKALSRPQVEIIRASSIRWEQDRTQRLIDICNSQGITHLVMGAYALESHDIGLLRRSGIVLLAQRFTGPADRVPAPGVMGLHYMIRDGLGRAATDFASNWVLER